VSPKTSYATFISTIVTGPRGSKAEIQPQDVTNPDGSHTVTLSGKFPLGGPSILYSYAVPQPSRFAQVAFVDALKEKGIKASVPPQTANVDFRALASSYVDDKAVAEHVSPPMSEEIKVTLKVSHNLHASMTPFILGAVLGHKTQNIDQGGFDLERDF